MNPLVLLCSHRTPVSVSVNVFGVETGSIVCRADDSGAEIFRGRLVGNAGLSAKWELPISREVPLPVTIDLWVRGRPSAGFATDVTYEQAEVVLGEQQTEGILSARGNARRRVRALFRSDRSEPRDLEEFTEVVFQPVSEPLRRMKWAYVKQPEETALEYVLWYATNRKPKHPQMPELGYTAQRDSTLHYGRCTVFIPRSHKLGSLGAGLFQRLMGDREERLRLVDKAVTSAATHWEEIRTRLRSLPPGKRHGVVFIHGYNVSFEAAALRAAQIGFDLGVPGAVSFFSWPSKGRFRSYPADEATIEASEAKIAQYLSDFARHSGASAVHIIVHSMGNRGVLRAINRIASRAEEHADVKFSQCILAAADVDVETFSELSSAYDELASRTTLYVSERDLAVRLSQFLHDYPRVGYTPPVTVLPRIDTVSVSEIDLTTLGHGYFAEAREVLRDMRSLLLRNTPPRRRKGLRRTQTPQGKTYWKFSRTAKKRTREWWEYGASAWYTPGAFEGDAPGTEADDSSER